MRKEDYYQEVADMFVQAIESDTAGEWEKGWNPSTCGNINAVSCKPYRGMNQVYLAAKRHVSKEPLTPFWITFKQAKQNGGMVKKGSKGTAVHFFKEKKVDRKGNENADVGEEVYRVMRIYHVFNLSQTEGLEKLLEKCESLSGSDEHGWDPVEEAERIVRNSKVDLRHEQDNRCYYDLVHDRVVMMPRGFFAEAKLYYSTLLHELGHWTGHESRLDRKQLRRGIEDGRCSPNYAREELLAEISSWMTRDALGIHGDTKRSTGYVRSWIEALQDDPKEIYRASRGAQEVSDYLLKFREHTMEEIEGREELDSMPLSANA